MIGVDFVDSCLQELASIQFSIPHYDVDIFPNKIEKAIQKKLTHVSQRGRFCLRKFTNFFPIQKPFIDRSKKSIPTIMSVAFLLF